MFAGCRLAAKLAALISSDWGSPPQPGLQEAAQRGDAQRTAAVTAVAAAEMGSALPRLGNVSRSSQQAQSLAAAAALGARAPPGEQHKALPVPHRGTIAGRLSETAFLVLRVAAYPARDAGLPAAVLRALGRPGLLQAHFKSMLAACQSTAGGRAAWGGKPWGGREACQPVRRRAYMGTSRLPTGSL